MLKNYNYYGNLLNMPARLFRQKSNQPLRHVLGANKTTIGKISSLPTSITKDSKTLEYGEYNA